MQEILACFILFFYTTNQICNKAHVLWVLRVFCSVTGNNWKVTIRVWMPNLRAWFQQYYHSRESFLVAHQPEIQCSCAAESTKRGLSKKKKKKIQHHISLALFSLSLALPLPNLLCLRNHNSESPLLKLVSYTWCLLISQLLPHLPVFLDPSFFTAALSSLVLWFMMKGRCFFFFQHIRMENT